MSPADDFPQRPPPPATALPADEPMDDERCRFVLSLLIDGRLLPAALERAAREYAATHPECARVQEDFATLRRVLAAEPAHRVPPDFAERVLAAVRSQGPMRTALPLAQRLAAAAALLLVLTLAVDLSHPGQAVADVDLRRQEHLIDRLRPDAFAPLALDSGLARLLPAPAPTRTAPTDEADPEDDR